MEKSHEQLLKEYEEYCEETMMASALGSERVLGFKDWAERRPPNACKSKDL